jgi:malate synthase
MSATAAMGSVSERLRLTASGHPLLTPEALAFVAELQEKFGPRRVELLRRRQQLQPGYDKGELPRFLEETKTVRESEWTVAPLPKDILDRRVEITGPVDRKMIINALNSGANVFMADFEDSNSPTWNNLVEGQQNLYDAVRRNISYEDPKSRKRYALNEKTAVLFVRPRGWHLPEAHVLFDNEPISGSLFDFAIYFFHNAKALLQNGTGPYFYLPKMESHLEARLWNDVFVHAQERLGIPRGTIKATVLIETLPAAFEMDEILWELRDHSAGLNCGRWDYIFSFIKKMRAHKDFALPDRIQVTMDRAFLKAYAQRLIQVCHRRNVHAMGGMAAQIPLKHDPAANEAAMAKVRADKLREVTEGHDGTWVAHPGLVPLAKEIFDAHMPEKNQLTRQRTDVNIGEKDLLSLPEGTRTETGLRHNIRVGVQYLAAWMDGMGCVPLYGLMEDAATAEISRAQVWQWMHHQVPLEDGKPLTEARFDRAMDEEMARVEREIGTEAFAKGSYRQASQMFRQLSVSPHFEDFLTLPAYAALIAKA